MKLNIQRFDSSKTPKIEIVEFKVKENETILSSLIDIKATQDKSITFRSGCKSGVCGSCTIRVNGVEKLACKTFVKENDLIQALKNTSIIKDLVVDLSYEENLLKNTKSYLHLYSKDQITQKDEKAIDIQSNCILCQSCYSSCPVYEVNKDFLGPYALTRALRYINDKKEKNLFNIIDSIQTNAIWDCTLCGNCTIVCPQFIDPKTDIMNLRMKSVQSGYEDKSLQMYQNDFNDGFDTGFNPSGGFDPNGF